MRASDSVAESPTVSHSAGEMVNKAMTDVLDSAPKKFASPTHNVDLSSSDESEGERQLKIPKRTHGEVHPQVGARQVHQSTKSKASTLSVKSDVSIGPGSVRDQFVGKSDKAQQHLSLAIPSRGNIPLPDEPHPDDVPLRRKLFEEKQSALAVKKASPIKNSPAVSKSGGMDVPPSGSPQGPGWIGSGYETSSGPGNFQMPLQDKLGVLIYAHAAT